MTFYCAPSTRPEGNNPAMWDVFMHEAVQLAEVARTHGDVPVGAVVVNGNGEIIGRGENQTIFGSDPTAHAEILAIRDAAKTIGNYRLLDAVLVVTLEPCIMCLGAIIQARLAGVVFGATDPKAGCLTSRIDGHVLPWSNHHFWVTGGILEDTCGAMLSEFFQKRRQEKKILKNLAER